MGNYANIITMTATPTPQIVDFTTDYSFFEITNKGRFYVFVSLQTADDVFTTEGISLGS